MTHAVLRVRVLPRARENGITLAGNVLQVRIHSAPVDGKANREMVKFLAKRLQIAPSNVIISRGEGSRHKVVQISELDLPEVMRRLGLGGHTNAV
jgi:uncharacterized protein (TIGR00251 family)